MMTNLFSAFDPATSKSLSLNWISIYSCILLLPMKYWLMPNRMNMVINNMHETLSKEFKMLLKQNSKGMLLLVIALFTFILMNNIMGLLPYIYTSTSHMVMNLTMALPLWLSLMLFGWINQTNNMFAHMIPTGTPTLLMPFMVLIETISNLIRPMALAVRLTANMIAGHLLMTLLGEKAAECSASLMLIFMVQMSLMIFEAAVALIQAYVFSVLTTLYTSEI
uniref:ATP synthase subunit a n=1 Tax=Neolethaeus assamensis TaxID=1589711 RepID=A0A343ISG9_9HEMI|nr:ATP synthase F0 subunit 6 [Neolethaeus assamensis]AST10194.1 ATP synthase F0 subunit 6 [Neolethaeus assamensis]